MKKIPEHPKTLNLSIKTALRIELSNHDIYRDSPIDIQRESIKVHAMLPFRYKLLSFTQLKAYHN